MSNDNNSASGDLPRNPMAGKYDGRKNNGATKARRRVFSDLGRRTNWAKHLEKTDVSKTLQRFEAIATPEDIFRKAWENGDLELCASLYRQFQDRLLGRPFVATNPNEVKTPGMPQDNRLQLAIQNLNILPQRSNREPATILAADSQRLLQTANEDLEHKAGQADATTPEESDGEIPESTRQLLEEMNERSRRHQRPGWG